MFTHKEAAAAYHTPSAPVSLLSLSGEPRTHSSNPQLQKWNRLPLLPLSPLTFDGLLHQSHPPLDVVSFRGVLRALQL